MNVMELPVVEGGVCLPYEIPANLKVWAGNQPPPQHGMIRIVNSKDGDKRVVWNSEVLAEIKDAKKMFDDMVAKGMVPYRIGDKGQRTPTVMREFDAKAEEIVFAPIQLARGG